MGKKTVAVLVLVSAWGLSVSAAPSQDAASKNSPTGTDRDAQLLRQDLRSNKKQLIAAEERTDRQRRGFLGDIKPKAAALAMLITIKAMSGGKIHESNAATS